MLKTRHEVGRLVVPSHVLADEQPRFARQEAYAALTAAQRAALNHHRVVLDQNVKAEIAVQLSKMWRLS